MNEKETRVCLFYNLNFYDRCQGRNLLTFLGFMCKIVPMGVSQVINDTGVISMSFGKVLGEVLNKLQLTRNLLVSAPFQRVQ